MFAENRSLLRSAIWKSANQGNYIAADASPRRPESPLISVPRISSEEWFHLFETTGLCQGYDLESDRPRPAGTPLFVVKSRPRNDATPKPGTPPAVAKRKKKPDRPVFLVDDQTRTVVEETFTERHKYMVEMGFSAGDLAISVPYVNASIKAEKKEREQSEQAVKTVYVTTRKEFPRCRVDIKASLLSGYLTINPHFIAEVERVMAAELDSYEEKKSRIAQLKQAIYDVWAQKPMSHLKKYELVLWCCEKAEEAKWKARADDLARLEGDALVVEGAEAVGERTRGGDVAVGEPGEERNSENGSAIGVKKQGEGGNEGTVAVEIEGNAGGLKSTAEAGQKGVNTEGVRTVEDTTSLPGAVLDSDSESAPGHEPGRAAKGPGKTEQLPSGSNEVPGRTAPVAGGSAQEPGRSAQEPGRSAQAPGRSAQEPGRSAQEPGRSAQVPGRSAQEPGAPSEASETGTRGSNLAPGSGSFPATQPSCFPAFFSRRRVEPAGPATSAPTSAPTGRGAVGESTMEKRDSSATKWAEVGLFQDRVLEVLRIECWKMRKERDRIIGTTLDLIKQFGAVWVENITMGAQSTSTKEETDTRNSHSTEKERSVGVGVAGQVAGGSVGVHASHGDSKKAGSEAAESSRKKTVNATGGDTIAFRKAQGGHWVQSIKSTENWRIISYRNIRLLSDVPGLDVPTRDDGTTTVRELLLQRLDAVSKDVQEVESKKDPPRRDLCGVLKDDMVGYWYGFEGSHHPGGFDREHTILQVRVNEVQEFESSSESGRKAVKGVLFRGIGEGIATRLFLVGEVFEVDHQISNSPYEPRGRVCMEVHCPARKEKYLYVGHVDRLGMHGTWSTVGGQIGTWTLAPVNANPIVGIDDTWTFMERESHINEPRRRWILPSDAVVATAEKLGGKAPNLRKLLDEELLKGTWQGYLLRQKRGAQEEWPVLRDKLLLLLGTNNDGTGRIDDWDEVDPDAPPPRPLRDFELPATWHKVQARSFEISLSECGVVGGAVGRRRFKVTGTAREGKSCFTLQGYIQQVPPKRPTEHDYPYLAKVDLTLTSARVLPSRLEVSKELKGHLDHLGMHGLVDDMDILGTRRVTTFALMPTQAIEKEVARASWSCFGGPPVKLKQKRDQRV